jgi:hypothetical protein
MKTKTAANRTMEIPKCRLASTAINFSQRRNLGRNFAVPDTNRIGTCISGSWRDRRSYSISLLGETMERERQSNARRQGKRWPG